MTRRCGARGGAVCLTIALFAPHAFGQSTTSSAPPVASASPAPIRSSVAPSEQTREMLSTGAEREAELVVARGRVERLAVLQACRDTHAFDYLTWIGAAGLITTGFALAINAFTTPAAPMDNPFAPGTRTPLQYFAAGIGPGLVLGGIGFPFPRGLVKDQDPINRACGRVEHPTAGPADPVDVDVAGHLMRDVGPPASPIVIGLLAIASVLCIAGTITVFVLEANNPGHYREIVQLAGGVDAGIVTGWFLIPPTPERSAASRYANGYYHHLTAPSPAPTASVTLVPTGQGGIGVGVGGTF